MKASSRSWASGRAAELADVDDPEHSLIFEPHRAIDDRPQIESIHATRDGRAHLEAELANLTGCDGRRGRRRDPVVPQPIRGHAEPVWLLVVAVEAEVRLTSPDPARPGLGPRVRELDPEVGDLRRRHDQVVRLALPARVPPRLEWSPGSAARETRVGIDHERDASTASNAPAGMRFSSETIWSGQGATFPSKNQFDPLSARMRPYRCIASSTIRVCALYPAKLKSDRRRKRAPIGGNDASNAAPAWCRAGHTKLRSVRCAVNRIA